MKTLIQKNTILKRQLTIKTKELGKRIEHCLDVEKGMDEMILKQEADCIAIHRLKDTIRDLNKKLADSRTRFLRTQQDADRVERLFENLKMECSGPPDFRIETMGDQIVIKVGPAPPVQYRGSVPPHVQAWKQAHGLGMSNYPKLADHLAEALEEDD